METKNLQDIIKKLHGCDSKYLESVPIKEEFQGKTVWEGIVEVFDLLGHPKAKQCYAWAYPDKGKMNYVTVLKVPPVDSPRKAVQINVVKEYEEGLH